MGRNHRQPRPLRIAALMASLAATNVGCAAITTSPGWTGGGMAVTGPLIDTPEIASELEEEEGPGSISARHILVMHSESRARPETIKRSPAAAKERAQACLRKLRSGADFSELVREYSDEPGAAERGGDLGAFRRGQMVKRFSDAAFALKVGEISEVIETAYGFHVIKRTR